VTCACGCAETFEPRRKNQRYLNPGHSARARKRWERLGAIEITVVAETRYSNGEIFERVPVNIPHVPKAFGVETTADVAAVFNDPRFVQMGYVPPPARWFTEEDDVA
jgi:hypothetical protein